MPVVWTIEEKCKRCYSCIRECPAKAIMVENGQAKVVESRCVACGHCVKVCSQNAKAVLRSIDNVLRYMKDEQTIAMLAPSFAAAFNDVTPEQVIGGIREIGFSKVVEVAFGADLVNRAYYNLATSAKDLNGAAKKPIIASSCPALSTYIQKYVPELLPNLAPIVSPMVAMGRVIRKIYGADIKIIFIGPCSAKKVEAMDQEVRDSVDEVLTFDELVEMWDILGIDPAKSEESEFDPPLAYLGRVYPVSGGLLRSAGLSVDVMDAEMLVTEGKARFLKLVESLKNNQVDAQFIDVLFCDGCINGPYMDHGVDYFTRKQKVVRYTEKGRKNVDYAAWKEAINQCQEINVWRRFSTDSVAVADPHEDDIQKILNRIDKFSPSDELNCGACGYHTCREYAIAVHQGLAESDMCLPYLIEKKERIQKQLQDSLNTLAETQAQLIQHEKLASIGQLAAGVAHEVNNPLGSIVLFAHLVKQSLAENDPSREDMAFIIEEAKRCQTIISGLLNFSRKGQLALKEQSVAEVIDRMIKAVRQQPQFHNVDIRVYVQDNLPDVCVDGDQLYQVFLNLSINAADAMPDGGTLMIRAAIEGDRLKIYFEDTGVGIEKNNLPKLFAPFFTTKQIGKSTGLGLAIAYGIVKMHNGFIRVHSSIVGEGTTFLIDIPVQTEVQMENNFEDVQSITR
jgi:two-component system, NtrC family, sensor kinase